MGPVPLILLFVPHTIRTAARSGIQRVVLGLARSLAALPGPGRVELVTWDEVDGAMRFCDHAELSHLFPDGVPDGIRVHPSARAIGLRFQDLVQQGAGQGETTATWMVLPEIGYHLEDGTEITARVITQAMEAGWHTAAVLYDLIPIQNPAYRSMREAHERYVAQLLRLDAVVAISRHVEAVFRRFVTEDLGIAQEALDAAGTRIGAVPLPDAEVAPDADLSAGAGPGGEHVLLLGTIEPRKQQVRVMRCYRRLLDSGAVTLPMLIVGSLHPDVAQEFRHLLDGEPRLRHAGYLPDAEVAEAFRRARFSVFASEDEGYGLPISESLGQGVPCLCADFGAMAEVAAGGGCLTVDVRDEARLETALYELASGDRLVARLRREIAARPRRGWDGYAADVAALLAGWSAPDGADLLHAALEAGADVPPGTFGPGAPGLAFGAAPKGQAPDPGTLRILRDPPDGRGCAGADVLLLSGPERLEAVMRDAGEVSLPGWVDTGARPAALLAEAVALRQRQRLVAARERNHAAALAAFDHAVPRRMLSIVISTYNRALFVAANAAWIIGQMERLHPAVELVVVDNASTDGSVAGLAPLLAAPGVRLVVNPGNVGMLGNLRVCSSLVLAGHVWMIGDDDFIVPGTLRRVLRALSVHPSVPLMLMNFGVYHRAAMTQGDSAAMFMAERQVLAPRPMAEGMTSVIAGGSEHDNLFTAIYPIVFRSDLAAAVFNHPFTGAPFRSLVESIPTTRFILENYALAEAYWIAEPGIVGNAHNSWQRYRVAWHAVLMPLALRLARRCGMDAAMLRRWAAVHVALFEEAQALFPTPGLATEFDADALAASHQVLLRRLLDEPCEPPAAPRPAAAARRRPARRAAAGRAA